MQFGLGTRWQHLESPGNSLPDSWVAFHARLRGAALGGLKPVASNGSLSGKCRRRSSAGSNWAIALGLCHSSHGDLMQLHSPGSNSPSHSTGGYVTPAGKWVHTRSVSPHACNCPACREQCCPLLFASQCCPLFCWTVLLTVSCTTSAVHLRLPRCVPCVSPASPCAALPLCPAWPLQSLCLLALLVARPTVSSAALVVAPPRRPPRLLGQTPLPGPSCLRTLPSGAGGLLLPTAGYDAAVSSV